MLALVPAFITSELKTAFQIGFLIYLPFLVIDMVVASVLDVDGYDDAATCHDFACPLSLCYLCLADGWYLLVGSLVQSFH